jgi:hypothetical protein
VARIITLSMPTKHVRGAASADEICALHCHFLPQAACALG